MQEQEKMVVVRFLVPESWLKRTYKLAYGYGAVSEIGRPGYLKELEERERLAALENETAKAS